MGIDADFIAVLQDLEAFLESLSNINLPNDLQKVRDNLLQRSRISLVAVGQRSTTPEPYLDMNVGKNRGLCMVQTTDVNKVNHHNQITEYMRADNADQLRLSAGQDYYEQFVSNATINSVTNASYDEFNDGDEELESIYRTFSSEQMISKAIKSGPLHLREERRLFGFSLFSGFDQFRICFIGLVGTHLLLYATKHDKHPSDIISIRGYSARASPNAIPRDLERSKSTFEIFSPGDRTFQFTARSPKEMEQWVAMICRAGNVTLVPAKAESFIKNSLINSKVIKKSSARINSTAVDEQYQDISCVNNEKQCQDNIVTDIDTTHKKKSQSDATIRHEQKIMISTSTNQVVSPPPLPARIPRRLPSLPHENSSSNIDIIDDGYDEDDIYHKIEDVKQSASTYQNLATAATIPNINDRCIEFEFEEKMIKNENKNYRRISLSHPEIYDDAQHSEISKISQVHNEQLSVTYDDIRAIVNDARKAIVKETRKKSFLHRVRYKKKSLQKDEAENISKKLNSNEENIQSQRKTSQEIPPYDNVLGFGIEMKKNNNYNIGNSACLPASRAISGKSSTNISSECQIDNEDFYDDIDKFQNNKSEKFQAKNSNQVDIFESSQPMNNDNLSRIINISQMPMMTTTNGEDECEHYKVPRPQDLIDTQSQVEIVSRMSEELYDDIAIVTNFRMHQDDSTRSNPTLPDKMQNPPTNVTKVWNRFASGRKFKASDSSLVGKNKQANGERYTNNTAIDMNEEIVGLKMNKFQKLINKMESSLSKPKLVPTMMNNSHNDGID